MPRGIMSAFSDCFDVHRYDLRFPFFSPLCYLRVYLIAQFWLNFPSVTGKEREEPLCTAVDNVDFMQ